MKKLLAAMLVALLMVGCGDDGESGEDSPESNQTSAETTPAKTDISAEGKPFTIPDLSMEMLWCKPGTFTMGSPKSEEDRELFGTDETQHTVTLTKGFWLGKHEVTQTQWQSIMKSNPSEYKGANHPVEKVSWKDATAFCYMLTERERNAGRLPVGWAFALPTEAQWEYACRAGTKTAYSFGAAITEKQVNIKRNIRQVHIRGILSSERVGVPRYAWKRLGVVPRLVRQRPNRFSDRSHGSGVRFASRETRWLVAQPRPFPAFRQA
jgi:formylglycine-generating enzyme required for sulfatase activity